MRKSVGAKWGFDPVPDAPQATEIASRGCVDRVFLGRRAMNRPFLLSVFLRLLMGSLGFGAMVVSEGSTAAAMPGVTFRASALPPNPPLPPHTRTPPPNA